MKILRTNLKSKENILLITILLFTGVLLAAPYVIRSINDNPTLPSSDSYHYLRLYSSITDKDSIAETFHDPLQDRNVEFNLLYLFPLKGDLMEISFQILPLLFGVITVLLVYFILKRHNLGDLNSWLILILLVISPIFLYLFTSFNFYAIIILLNMLAVFFIAYDRPLLGAVFLLLIPFISFQGGLLSFIFLSVYLLSNSSYLRKNMRKNLLVLLLLFFAVVLSLAVNIVAGHNPLSTLSFDPENMITDIGAYIGFSFSMIVLAIIGFVLLWEKGWKNIVIYSAMVIFMVLSLMNSYIRIYLNFIIVIYAGFALLYLTRRKWSIALIKKTTLLLIVCSILFSTIFYTTQLVRAQPSSELVEALAFIKQQSFENETVYSSVENGYLIEYFAERESFVDATTALTDPDRMALYNNISTSRNFDRTTYMLEQHNIRYFVVDENLAHQLERDEGLLFLIENSQAFYRIYSEGNVDVWMYTAGNR